MASRRLSLALLVALCAPALGMYSKKDDVVQLDEKSFKEIVLEGVRAPAFAAAQPVATWPM